MRKLLRWVGVLAGSAVLLALVLVSVSVAPVHREAFDGTPYARNADLRLVELGRAVDRAHAGLLRAGFGRLLLTPKVGVSANAPERGEFVALPLAGYGNRGGRSAEGVLDGLWVKAVALDVGGRTGVLVAADALIIPREVAALALEQIRRETGLERDQVYLGSTHTHCGLGGWGQGVVAEIFAGGFVSGAREWMAGRIAGAVAAALSDLSPAAAGTGGFEAPEFTRNRLVGEQGRLDPRFSLISVQQADGDRAVVGSFSAHATVLSGRMMRFSGDYPGVWQREVEMATGGMAVFLAGAVGSHAPKPPEGGTDGMRKMGAGLASATLRALEGITRTNRLRWDIRGLEVELPGLQLRVADGWRTREWVARRLLPVGKTTWLQYLRLGDAVWLSTPCDYSGEMAMDLSDATRSSGVTTAVTSFNGDYVGYVVPAKYYGMNTYETRTMAFFGPQLPDYFDYLLRGLVKVAAEAPLRESR